MKIRAVVNLNRIPPAYTILDDFEKARQYFLKHGVEFEFTFKNTSVNGYLSVWNGSRWVLNQTQSLVPTYPATDITMFVFDRAEWKNPPGSQYPLKPNAPTGNCFIYQGKPFINVGTYVIDNGADTNEIAHELMHGLVKMANEKGMNIQDVMDTYINNDDWDYPTGNFSQQWTLLKPFLNTSFFKTQEFVSRNIYTQWGEKSLWFVDPRIIKLANFCRTFFGKQVTINNWLWNGTFDQRGFREPESTTGGKLSQHRFGRAIDITVRGMTAFEVYNAILANEKAFMDAGLTCLEDIADTPSWTHLDIRETGLSKILIVKP